MSDKTRRIILIVGAAVMVVGVLGILYPFVGERINRGRTLSRIDDYVAEMESVEESESDALLEAARAYNAELFARTGGNIGNLTDEELEEYNAQLAMSATTIMGTIDIPRIGQTLPVYHGTSEAVLQEGVGHLEGSSLPVGGPSTHTVLMGHAGLPSKKFFTDLDEMETGDTFTVTVLNETVTYEVDGITVVLPDDVELDMTEDADECTLITCTPVGVNTHRLLVHAHRADGTN